MVPSAGRHPPTSMVGRSHAKASGAGCCSGCTRAKVCTARCSAATPPLRARMPPSMHTPCALPAVPLRWLAASTSRSSSCHGQLSRVPSESALSANSRNSLERALLNFFGRCARQVVENAACCAGNHHSRPTPRARVSAHATLSLWPLSLHSSVTRSAQRNSIESVKSLFSGAARAHGHSVASSCSHSCSYGPPAPACPAPPAALLPASPAWVCPSTTCLAAGTSPA